MIEKKFRAWDKKNNKMYERAGISPHGDLQYAIKKRNGGSSYFNFDDLHIKKSGIYYPDNIILMQYTGLKDKNEKEIYENDILYNKDSIPYEYYQVEDMFELYHYDWEQIIEVERSEIIGDIYQNPELIKKIT